MALPATPSPSHHPHPHSDCISEHTQHAHRNTSAGQKRRHDDLDDADSLHSSSSSSIASGLKRLRIFPHAPLPQRPITGFNFRQNDSIQPPTNTHTHTHVLPNSSAFPTSHPAYLQPQHLSPLPSPLHLTPGKGSLANYLSPNLAGLDRNYNNTPPPHSLASSSRASTFNDMMTLDHPNINPPNRIIINDLDAEIAEIEAEEESSRQKDQEHAFFLPDDVEKRINSIPDDVLRSNTSATIHAPPSQALILYKDPTSISMPEEEDAVRRAVREARARLREKHKPHPLPDHQHPHQTSPHMDRVAPPWPGFQPIMDDDPHDLEEQRRYQESAHHWSDDDDAMEIG